MSKQIYGPLVKMPLSWICLKVQKFTQFFMLPNLSLFVEMMTFQSYSYPIYLLKTNLKSLTQKGSFTLKSDKEMGAVNLCLTKKWSKFMYDAQDQTWGYVHWTLIRHKICLYCTKNMRQNLHMILYTRRKFTSVNTFSDINLCLLMHSKTQIWQFF